MKRFIRSILFLSLIFSIVLVHNSPVLSKTKKQKKYDSKVLATVGPEKITYGLLEQAFRKNMNQKDINLNMVSKDSVMDFLSLYIKYRLKVLDAVGRGFDKDSAVLADIDNNRKILAESFYYDKKLVDPNVNNIIKLRNTDLKFAYILITFDRQGKTEDTSKAYEKAMDVLNKLNAGENFEELAKKMSDDKETSKKGGHIPSYISGGMVHRPIEKALFSLKKKGDIYPELIKTKYGYFILKLVDKKPRIGVLGRHILLSEGIKEDSAAVEKTADSIITLLKNGADFVNLAEKFSDDTKSAMNGGSLGEYYFRSTGFEKSGSKLLASFEQALFALEDGEFSGKVRTDYGIHIVKREKSKKIDPETERDQIRKLYKRLYFETDKKDHIESLRAEYGFKAYENILNDFVSLLDTTKSNIDTSWANNVTDDLKDMVLYKILDDKFKVGYMVDQMKTNPELKGTPLTGKGIMRAIGKLTTHIVFKKASANLETEYPEFAVLMKEFRDGILLFRVEAIEVWNKLKFDSVLARDYYEKTKDKYKTNPQLDLTEIYVLSKDVADSIYNQAKAGAEFQELAAASTQRGGFKEKNGNWGLVSVEDNELAKKAMELNAKPGDILEPMKYEKGYSIVRVNKFEDVRQKTFEEAIPDFAPEFQDMMQKNLTETWLGKVREKYPVKIEYKVINKLLKK